MIEKTKITEIKETYSIKSRIKGDGFADDGTKFENKTLVRFKEVPPVEGWARFAHYIIDIGFYYLLSFILGIALALGLVLMGFSLEEITNGAGINDLADRLISWLILYPGYYILFESIVQSTPGKLILGRVVVNEYGEKPSFLVILKRSYSRIVPFETFSCLSTLGWHDTWSDTFVIRKNDLAELKLALKVQHFNTDTVL